MKRTRLADGKFRSLPESSVRVAVLSDAASERNEVGSYYYDLVPQFELLGFQIEMFHPERYQGCSLPMPGDSTQRLPLPPVRALHQQLCRFDPHLLVLPTPGFYGLYGLWFAGRKKRPFIVAHHTDLEALTSHYCRPPWDSVVRLGWRTLNERLFRRAEGLVTTCARMESQINDLGVVSVFRPGTVLGSEFMRPPVRRAGPLRSILFAGRLAAEKNLVAFLQASQAYPDIEFHSYCWRWS